LSGAFAGGASGVVAVSAAQVIGERGSRSERRGVQVGGGVRPAVVAAQPGQLQQFFQGGPLIALEKRRQARVEGEHAFAKFELLLQGRAVGILGGEQVEGAVDSRADLGEAAAAEQHLRQCRVRQAPPWVKFGGAAEFGHRLVEPALRIPADA
jgi:hypothetical protein